MSNTLTYKDIQTEIEAICRQNPGCWHTPEAEIKCPYKDVCYKEYEGPDNGAAALEAAMVQRYKDLHGLNQSDDGAKPVRICPRCGQPYTDHPALSRADGETPICPDCGTREALESIGKGKEEQDTIIKAIHHTQRKEGGI